MKIVNIKLAEAQRHAGVERGVELDLAGVESHCESDRLEGRPHLVGAFGQPVDAREINRVVRIVRVIVGHRDHGEDFTRPHIHHDASRRQGLELVARPDELIAHGMLYTQIDR